MLSLTAEAQQAAAAGSPAGAGTVVVLDVRTGAVVAMYSNPTFDPNPLAIARPKKAQAVRTFLLARPDKPLLARAWRELYPPGSTFKTVTASIALTPTSTSTSSSPVVTELPLPR